MASINFDNVMHYVLKTGLHRGILFQLILLFDNTRIH